MDILDLIGLYAKAATGAILPALVMMFYIFWYDRKHQEPVGQLIKGFICGICSLCMLYLLWDLFPAYFEWARNDGGTVLGKIKRAFFAPALSEEFVKLVMLWVLVSHNKYFDECIDGIVYAVCVGMGFAAVENLQYVFSSGANWNYTAAQRAILAVPGHYINAVAMGYFYSMARFFPKSGRKRLWQLSLILLAPVMLHGIYDSIAFVLGSFPIGSYGHTALMLALFYFCYELHKQCNYLIEQQITIDDWARDNGREKEMKKGREEAELRKQREQAEAAAQPVLSEDEKRYAVQQAFIKSRTYLYIPDEDAMRELNRFLTDTTQQALVVTGASGAGKSALIANWITQHSDNQNLIWYFIGNGCIQTDYMEIAHYLHQKIQQLNQPLVIVLDGLDQLTDIDDAKHLKWLPTPSAQVRYIFSCCNDDSVKDILKRRGYPMVEVSPLHTNARKNIISHYVQQGLMLAPEQEQRIADDPESANPLVLRSVLHELSWSSPEEMDAHINHYLEPCSISDYFIRILDGFEQNLGEFAVQQMLSMIAAGAEFGLTKQEIQKATKMYGKQNWEDLMKFFGYYLTEYEGRYSISHQLVYNAIVRKYARLMPTARQRVNKVYLLGM